MKRIVVTASLLLILSTVILTAQEQKLEYGGIVYRTEVLRNRVRVRELPSLASKVLFKVGAGDKIAITGISNKSALFGVWLRMEVAKKDEHDAPQTGWIYGRFVKNASQFRPSIISALAFDPETLKTRARLTLSINRNGKEQNAVVYPYKVSSQRFYTFTWSTDNESFVYTDVPGTYVWYPDTNKTAHITYMGDHDESAWVCFTDDLKYVLQDFGTGPGVRALGVWIVKNGAEVYSGSYVSNALNMKNHEIDIVFEYDDWNIQNKQIDAETEKHALDYRLKNPMPEQRSDGLTNTLLVEYRLNLDSRARKFLGCEYTISQ